MAFKLPRIEATIQMVDRVAAPMRKINQSIASAMEPVNRLQSSLQSLSREMQLGKLSAATKGFKEKLGGIGDGFSASLGNLSKLAFIGGGSLGGLFAAIDGAASAGDKIAKFSRRVGLSVEGLQEWRFAAERSGVAMEAFDAGVNKFGKIVGEAASGTGVGLPIFDALGIKVKTASGAMRSQQDILLDLADGFKKVKNPTDRLRMALTLFEEGGGPMIELLSQGREGVQALTSEFRALGGGMSTEQAAASEVFQDKLSNLKVTLASVANLLTSQLIPVVSTLMVKFQEWALANRGPIQEYANLMAQKLPGAIEGAVSAIKGLVAAAKPVIAVFQFLSGIFGSTTVILTALGAYIAGPLVLSVLAAIPALITLTTTFIAAIPPAVAFAASVLAISWPALAVVAALAAVGAAVYLLYRNWDSVSKFLDTSVGKVLSVMLPFVGIPLQIIKHWGGIKTFFANLWNSVLSGASKVRSVLESIPLIGGAFGSGVTMPSGPAGAPATGATAAATQSTAAARKTELSSRLYVDFTNLPMGARVGQPVGPAPVDISAGYSLAGAGGF